MRSIQFQQLVAAALVIATALAAPNIYMAGDSTMVVTGNSDGTEGWAAPFADDTSLTVVDDAMAGRSARSFTREGRFTAMAANVKAGDYVIIEFGHNDGGSLTPTDNGRSECSPGSTTKYAAVCYSEYNGVNETVLTYEAYIVNAAKLFIAKGANVIISSATPDNPWETGTFVYSASRFVGYCEDAAAATGATFVDHGLYTANSYKSLGSTAVDAFYPHDHTHTSPAGATVVATAFAQALKVTSSTLNNYITHY